jgi:Zn-dependent protease with chaperone function
MPYPAHAYQHPLDLQGLRQLRAFKFLEKISKTLVAADLETDLWLLQMSDNVRLNPQDFPALHQALEEACEVLELVQRPQVFLDTRPEPHCSSFGDQNPLITISTGLLDLLEEDELQAALAHEVAHLACGHAYYNLLAENFSGLTEMTGLVPGLSMATMAVKLPLLDWYRKSDLSADRGAVLVLGGAEPLVRMIGKLAGGNHAHRVSHTALVEQAKEAEELLAKLKTGNLQQRATFLFSNLVMQGMLQSQPWPSIRIKEVLDWVETVAAKDLLAGKIPTPEEEQSAPTSNLMQRWADRTQEMGKSMWDKLQGGSGSEE